MYNVEIQEETGEAYITADNTITELEQEFPVVHFNGNDGFDSFVEQGRAEYQVMFCAWRNKATNTQCVSNACL